MPVSVPDGCLLVQAGKQLERLTGGHVLAGFHEVRRAGLSRELGATSRTSIVCSGIGALKSIGDRRQLARPACWLRRQTRKFAGFLYMCGVFHEVGTLVFSSVSHACAVSAATGGIARHLPTGLALKCCVVWI